MSRATAGSELELIRRHGWRPDYAPAVPRWDESFGAAHYRRCAAASNELPIPDPLALDVRLPAPASPLGHGAGLASYLEYLRREIALQGALYDRDRSVVELRLGNEAAPLEHAELGALLRSLHEHFTLDRSEEREHCLAADPLGLCRGDLRRLADAGFNRLSFGESGAGAANAVTARVHDAHALGFRSVSLAFCCAPQDDAADAAERSLEAVLAARPDRVVARAGAADARGGPGDAGAAALLERACRVGERLTAAGYLHIGLDQYALPEDDLARAQGRRRLAFALHGYCPLPRADHIGLGAGATSRVGACHAQNAPDPERYCERLRGSGLAVVRGSVAGAEQEACATLVQQLLCYGEVRIGPLELRHGIAFHRHFAAEIERLRALERDGFLRITDTAIEVPPRGRLLLAAIAETFRPGAHDRAPDPGPA
jgi:oxygen-independent coproporphyrinogen-3 oxidase